MGLLFLVQRARLRHADLWSFHLVFLTIPFALKTSWPHDFVFLSFTQAALVWRLPERSSHASAWREWIPRKRAAVTLCLLLASIVVSNIVFFNLFGDFEGYGFYGFLFRADLLLLIALYVELLPDLIEKNGG